MGADTTLGVLNGLKVCMVHPANRDTDAVAGQLAALGCIIQHCWPLTDHCVPQADVVVVRVDCRYRPALLALSQALRKRDVPLIALVNYQDLAALALMLELNPQASMAEPLNPFALAAQLNACVQMTQQLRHLKQELAQSQRRLFLHTKLSRAKLLLMSERHLDEGSAHRLLRSEAMNRRCTLEQVADRIIDNSLNLTRQAG
ncbi:ANTAR domain-containing response regulator [Pseudomonas graminis]